MPDTASRPDSLVHASEALSALLHIQPRTCASRVILDTEKQAIRVLHPNAFWLSPGDVPRSFEGWSVYLSVADWSNQ